MGPLSKGCLSAPCCTLVAGDQWMDRNAAAAANRDVDPHRSRVLWSSHQQRRIFGARLTGLRVGGTLDEVGCRVTVMQDNLRLLAAGIDSAHVATGSPEGVGCGVARGVEAVDAGPAGHEARLIADVCPAEDDRVVTGGGEALAVADAQLAGNAPRRPTVRGGGGRRGSGHCSGGCRRLG